MRCALLALVAAGCGFSASAPPASEGNTAPDAGSSAVAKAKCDSSDPAIRLCMTFDGDPMVQDLSIYNHPIADIPNSQQPGRIPHDSGWAASFASGTTVVVDETSDLDLGELTIDMWIQPASIAPGASYWLLDNNTEYFMSYEGTQKIRCGIGGGVILDSSAKISDPSWHHVACTFKPGNGPGSPGDLRVYVDSAATCDNPKTAVPNTGDLGTAIGANYGAGGYTDHYIGAIDSLHVFARALMPNEICQLAGQTGCKPSCDGGDGPNSQPR